MSVVVFCGEINTLRIIQVKFGKILPSNFKGKYFFKAYIDILMDGWMDGQTPIFKTFLFLSLND